MTRLAFIAAALSLTSGCLDWNTLRGARQSSDAAVSDAGGGAGTQPIVAWYFETARALDGTPGEVPDDAPPVPTVALARQPDDNDPPGGSAAQMSGALVLANASLGSEPGGYEALRDFIAAAGGALSVEIWIDALTVDESAAIFSLGTTALVINQSSTGLAALLQTNTGASDVTANLAPGTGRHQVVVTWRPQSGIAMLYLDGALAGIDTTDGRALAWPDGAGGIVLAARGWSGQILSVAIFDRSLDEGLVAQRFAAGPR